MKLRRIPENELCRWWEGYCWHDWPTNDTVVAPLGLNVILAAARWAWLWVRVKAPLWLSRNEPKDKK